MTLLNIISTSEALNCSAPFYYGSLGCGEFEVARDGDNFGFVYKTADGRWRARDLNKNQLPGFYRTRKIAAHTLAVRVQSQANQLAHFVG